MRNGHPLVIACAPNGARRGAHDHTAIPLTPGELAATAAHLPDAGVSLLHLHVRDKQGRHTLDPDTYREAIEAIRKETGRRLVIQVTTEAVGIYSPDEQMAVVEALKPEAVSLALAELCPDQAWEPAAGRFFSSLRRNGTWPQYILYTVEQLERFERLRAKGFFGEDHPACLLVMGSYVKQTDGTREQLDSFLESIDIRALPWSVCCFGKSEQEVLLHAANLGGSVRIGFENNLWLPDGTLAQSNLQLLQAFTAALEGTRAPATADEIREACGVG